MRNIIAGFIIVLIIVIGVVVLSRKSSNSQINVNSSLNPVPSATSQPQDPVNGNTVMIKNFTFSPSVLMVKKGTTVTWINQDTASHNIKSDTFNSTELNQGDQFQFTFNTAGTFNYSCGIHPSMTGQIIVQ